MKRHYGMYRVPIYFLNRSKIQTANPKYSSPFPLLIL